MKIFFILLYIFLPLISFSQENLKVVYSTNFIGSVFGKAETKETEIFVNESKGSEKEINSLEFILEYDGNKSLFKSIKKLEQDNEKMGSKIGKIIAAYDNVYFKNKSSNLNIEELSLGGKRYFISKPFDRYKWELTDQVKQIQSNICYLAKSDYNGLNVFAWYCPNLPYAIGPRDYGGLPGLILELQVGKLVFLANKIEFPENLIIKYETENIKTITPEEMLQITNEFADSIYKVKRE